MMIKKLFSNNKFILGLILINTAIIFLGGFKFSRNIMLFLSIIDNVITGLFIIEILFKFKNQGIKSYFDSNWNRLDFLLIILSIPSLFAFLFNLEVTSFSFLLVFRVLRIFKSFRFIKFVPGIDHLISGLGRALKASIIVLLGFIIYIFIIGIFSFYLYYNVSPQYFGDPLISLFSVFKIFTIEGWYEIPEQLTLELSPIKSFATYVYFIFVVLSGGILGLSLVNSIFVDAMVSDNNDDLEKKIDVLNSKIDKLLTKNDN